MGGLQLNEINQDTIKKYRLPAGSSGVLVENVAPKSKAEKVGFQAGDVIIQVEDIEITSLQDIQQAIDMNKNQHKRVYVNRYGQVILFVIK